MQPSQLSYAAVDGADDGLRRWRLALRGVAIVALLHATFEAGRAAAWIAVLLDEWFVRGQVVGLRPAVMVAVVRPFALGAVALLTIAGALGLFVRRRWAPATLTLGLLGIAVVNCCWSAFVFVNDGWPSRILQVWRTSIRHQSLLLNALLSFADPLWLPVLIVVVLRLVPVDVLRLTEPESDRRASTLCVLAMVGGVAGFISHPFSASAVIDGVGFEFLALVGPSETLDRVALGWQYGSRLLLWLLCGLMVAGSLGVLGRKRWGRRLLVGQALPGLMISFVDAGFLAGILATRGESRFTYSVPLVLLALSARLVSAVFDALLLLYLRPQVTIPTPGFAGSSTVAVAEIAPTSNG